MAEISRRRVGELVRGVFEILAKHPQGLPAKEVLREVRNIVPPTPFESEEYPNRPGVRRYEKIIRFSTIQPVKAGWMTKAGGLWSLTEEGSQALRDFRDPERFATEARKRYMAWKADRPDDEVEVEGAGQVLSPRAAEFGTLEEAEEAAWESVRDHLERLPPYEFQRLVAALLEAMDYHVAWVAPPGKDGGIDLLAYRDPLGTLEPRIKVQVKRRSERVTVDGLRAFAGSIGAHDVGIYVSLAGFTADAETTARGQNDRKITLIDGRRLVDLWVEHLGRIDDSQRYLLPLKPIYYLAPEA